jgi:hypothetical protein
VRSDRQQRAAIVEITRIDRRLTVLVDDPSLRHLFALVDGDHQFALSDHRGRHVENRRIAACNRHADRERIGRQSPIAAPVGRDALGPRRVQKMQRDLSGIRSHLCPIAEATQMPAIAKADHRDAFLRRLRDAKLRREFADHLSEAAVPVDDRERVGIEHQCRRLIRFEPSVAHPFEILGHANHAVRIVPDEV